MVTCNSTLDEQTSMFCIISNIEQILIACAVVEDPLFAKVTFHHVGLVISAVFSLISVVVAFFLIFKHATHYSKPWEQKQYA